MDRKRFTLYSIIIVMAVGALVGSATSSGNMILPVLAMFTGIVMLRALKRRVNEVIEDERTYRVSEKASRRTLETFGILTALVGEVLIVLGNKGIADVAQAGYTLAHAVCFLLLLYMAFYGYYNRKYGDDGGSEE